VNPSANRRTTRPSNRAAIRPAGRAVSHDGHLSASHPQNPSAFRDRNRPKNRRRCPSAIPHPSHSENRSRNGSRGDSQGVDSGLYQGENSANLQTELELEEWPKRTRQYAGKPALPCHAGRRARTREATSDVSIRSISSILPVPSRLSPPRRAHQRLRSSALDPALVPGLRRSFEP